MSYIGITKQLRIIAEACANVDANYGPYTSIQKALSAIPIALRKEGLTVGIIENKTVTEYWFNSGVANENLVLKTGGSQDLSAIIQALAEKVDKEPNKFLMTQAERDFIQALIEGGGGGGSSTDMAVLKALFLSKVVEDSAKEKITFDKGLTSQGLARMVDTYFGDYSSGIHTGKGAAITKEGHGELESLIVRSFLEVPELRYNRLSLVGEEIAVGAGGVIEEVSPVVGGYRIKLKLEQGELNPFWYDDIIKGIYHHDNGFQTTWCRVVSSTDANSPYLDVVLRPSSSGPATYPAPVPFMHIARWGNFNSNPALDTSDRQSVLILSAKTGSITFYDGINNYGNGYVNSKWGKPQGLEFIKNFENLPINSHDPVLYLRTLLVQDIFRVNHEGYTIQEERDRGLWSYEVATGDTPYESRQALVDTVWHNKIKYRCIVHHNTEEPMKNSPYWLFLFSLEDGISSLQVLLSNPNIVLKANTDGVIENYAATKSTLKVKEGSTYLTPILKTDPKENSTFWLDSVVGNNIDVGSISVSSSSKVIHIEQASNMVGDVASIVFIVKGKRANGEDFTEEVIQDLIRVEDGKGLQITLKGAKNTLAEIEAVVNPSPGDAWVNREDGHVYVWDGSTWNDSGQFKGDPGENSRVHFAYADVILTDALGQYAPPLNDDGLENFTINDYADKRWLGVYWDYDPVDSLNSRDYNWTRVAGPKGDPGDNGTSITIKGRVANPSLLPSVGNTLGDGYMSEDTGSLWIFDNNTQDTYLDEIQGPQYATFGWVNVGQIKGESSYIHVAWADDVIFHANDTFKSVVGFTTLNGNKKRWYGIYVDERVNDANEEEAHKYNWTDTKGEAGKDSHSDEFIFILNNNPDFGIPRNTPTSEQTKDFVPVNWSDDPIGVSSTLRYEWVSKRKFRDEIWEPFSTPTLWNMYIEDGVDGKDSKSDEFIFRRNNNPNFGIADNRPGTDQADDYVPPSWSDDPTGVTPSEKYEWVCKRIFRNGSWSAFSIPSLWAKWSEDGKSPYVGRNGNWYIWDYNQDDFIDSGDPSQGDNGNSPRINASGYWEVWGDTGNGVMGWIPTGVKARGTDGKDSKSDEFIFIRNNDNNFGIASNTPTSIQQDDYVPTNWTDDPVGVNSNNKYEWVSTRKFRNNSWGAFSTPSIWNIYVTDGDDGKDSKSDEFIFKVNNDSAFNKASNRPYSNPNQDDYQPTGWTDDPTGPTSQDRYEWVCKRIFKQNTQTWSEFSIPALWANFSKDGDIGVSISSVTEYYLASSLDTGITINSPGWETSLQALTPTEKYLWNYEKINFSNGLTHPTSPVIIGVYGDTGRSVVSIEERYLTSPFNTGITRTSPGWSASMQRTTSTDRYLWNYEIVNWNKEPLKTYVEPVIIGVHGEKGKDGQDSKAQEFIFIRNNNPTFNQASNRPLSVNSDDYVPSGWTDDPMGVSPNLEYEWVSKRAFKQDTETNFWNWGEFSIPAMWAKYSKDGDATKVATPYMAGEWQGQNVSGQWLSTREYKRDQYSYPVVSWLKDPQDKPIYYFLKKEVTLNAGSPSPKEDYSSNLGNWQLADGYEMVITEALFSNFAKLGSFIFKENKLFSQSGETYAGIPLAIDEYIEYNFANTASKPPVISTSWTDLPSGPITWMRYKKNKNPESSWTVKQVGTSANQWQLQFATQPEGETWYDSYSTNRFWMRYKTTDDDYYGKAVKITTEGGVDYTPNIFIDGVTGRVEMLSAKIRGNVTSQSLITRQGMNDYISLNEVKNGVGDNMLKFRYPNGNLAAKFGLDNNEEGELVPAMIWYDENGVEIWRAGKDGVKYVTKVSEQWKSVKMFRVATLGNKETLTSADNTDIATGLSTIKCSIDGTSSGQYGLNANVTYYNYTPGVNPQAEANEQYRGLHTSKVKSTTNWIPAGWYVNPIGTLMKTNSSPDLWGFTLYRYDFGKLVSQYFAENVDLGTTTTQCPVGLGL